jgi:heptosyltransferase-2
MSSPPPRKLLIRGVNWLGDAVMSTPALLRLRAALPDTHLALLTRAKLADLWHSHPAIDEVIRLEPGESVWEAGGKLRSGGFDSALILPNSPRSALEVWLAGIPRRVGYTRPWRNWFLTEVIPTRAGHVKMRKRRVAEIKQLVRSTGEGNLEENTGPPPSPMDCAKPGRFVSREAHQMNEYLHLVAALGADGEPLAPALAVDASEVEAALAKFTLSRDGQWLGLNAGAEYGPAKRWPKDRFIAAATAVQQQTGCGLLIFGGLGDADVAAEIATQIRNPQSTIHNVAGRTSLRELMALLTRCRVLLTNDTGPMHVAAALGVPVVVPFGSTSPELTGPGLPGDPRHRLIKSHAPCSPCFLRTCPIDFRCLTGIAVEQVVNSTLEIWARPD